MSASELALAGGVALIFDLDGVVVDSMPVHTLAWQRYLRELGVDREDVAVRMHGRRNDEIVREFLGPDVPEPILFEHGAAKERLYRSMIGEELKARLVPGVEQLLARTQGVPVALARSEERRVGKE